jgi:hypothetical protein
MKLLLTSAGISNVSIRDALVEFLGKPIAEASALFVPTAIYALPGGGEKARRVICGSLGFPCSGRPTPCWLEAATASICPTVSITPYVVIAPGWPLPPLLPGNQL